MTEHRLYGSIYWPDEVPILTHNDISEERQLWYYIIYFFDRTALDAVNGAIALAHHVMLLDKCKFQGGHRTALVYNVAMSYLGYELFQSPEALRLATKCHRLREKENACKERSLRYAADRIGATQRSSCPAVLQTVRHRTNKVIPNDGKILLPTKRN